ncbi:hypothetical protein ACFX2C_004525 [Malus domestica]
MAKTSMSICLSVLLVLFIVFAVAVAHGRVHACGVQIATRHAQNGKVRLLEPAYFSNAFAMMVKVVRKATSLNTNYMHWEYSKTAFIFNVYVRKHGSICVCE